MIKTTLLSLVILGMTMTANAWNTNVWTSRNHTLEFLGYAAIGTNSAGNTLVRKMYVDIQIGGSVTASVEVQFQVTGSINSGCTLNNSARGYGRVSQEVQGTLYPGEGMITQSLTSFGVTKYCYDYLSNGQQAWNISGATKTKYFPNGGLFELFTSSQISHTANHYPYLVAAVPKITISN